MFDIGYEIIMHDECFAIYANFNFDDQILYLSSTSNMILLITSYTDSCMLSYDITVEKLI